MGTFNHQRFVNEAMTGVNGGALNATVTGSAISVEGFNYCTVDCHLTHDSASEIQLGMQTSEDQTTWSPVQEIRATATAGTYSSADWSLTKAVSGNDDWVWNFPINYKNLRLVFTSTAGAAADTIVATVRLGNV